MAQRGLLRRREEVVFFSGLVFSEAVEPCVELVGKGEGATGKATAAEPLRRIEIGEYIIFEAEIYPRITSTQDDRLK
jgi:hypothetical protein